MEKYTNLGYKNKGLRKGFYRGIHSERVYYFTGEYNSNGLPIIFLDGEIIENESELENSIKRFKKIKKEKVNDILSKLKQRVDWLENSLKKDNLDNLRKDYENMKKKS